MSLEKALAENTAAVNKLTTLLSQYPEILSGQTSAPTTDPAPAPVGSSPTTGAVGADVPSPAAGPADASVSTPSPETSAGAGGPAVTRDDVRAALTKLAMHSPAGKSAARTIVSECEGAKSLNDVGEQHFAEIVEKCTARLAELEQAS